MLALGIDLTRGAIAIGLVETSGRAPRLVGSWREERDAGRTAAEQLRAMIDRHCTQRPDAIASALPGSAVSHRVLRLPFSDAGRLAATVPFELESLVPFDVESGVIAFTALERDGAGATVLAAIAQRRDVKQHLDLLADAGVDPAVVDLGTLAVAALLRPRTTDLLLVEPRDDGGVCLVRVVHSLFASTDDWDGQLEGTEHGWPGFFRTLRIYLTHFRNQRSALMQFVIPVPGTEAEAWDTLTAALAVKGVSVGARWTTPAGVPALGGVAEYLSQSPHDALLRLDTPGPGVAALGAFSMGSQSMVALSVYHYGDRADETAARETPAWNAWIQSRFPASSEADTGA